MHEATLLRDIFQKIHKVAELNNAEKVTSVTLELGALAHISADHLREHFEEDARGTIVESAQLTIVENPDIHHPLAQEIILREIDVMESALG